jgi:hypothetical protein
MVCSCGDIDVRKTFFCLCFLLFVGRAPVVITCGVEVGIKGPPPCAVFPSPVRCTNCVGCAAGRPQAPKSSIMFRCFRCEKQGSRSMARGNGATKNNVCRPVMVNPPGEFVTPAENSQRIVHLQLVNGTRRHEGTLEFSCFIPYTNRPEKRSSLFFY